MKTNPQTISRIWQSSGLPAPETEYPFAKAHGRKWRADYCWPGKLIVECDGGVWSGGRHTRGSGFVKDMEKLNFAAQLGFRILRYQPREMLLTATIEQIRATLQSTQ